RFHACPPIITLQSSSEASRAHARVRGGSSRSQLAGSVFIRSAIGYLSHGTPEGTAPFVGAVRKGLAEAKLVEGKNVTSELRWARHDADRLPALAAELVQRVTLIVTLDTVAAARAAKAATTEIPIVFALGTDPVQAGLVASLDRPGGNITGISTMNLDLGSKWIE